MASGRWIGVLGWACAMTVLSPRLAFAGAVQREPGWQPSLEDEARDRITDEQAIAGAQKLLAAIGSKNPVASIRVMAIPYTQHLTGGQPHRSSDEGCFDAQRYTDEHEGLPGAPQCLAQGLRAHAGALGQSLTPERVFPNLAALEAKEGKLEGPVRKLLRPLKHHRLVLLQATGELGPARVVLALRRYQGRVSVDAVSGVLPRRKPRAAP